MGCWNETTFAEVRERAEVHGKPEFQTKYE